MILAFCYVVFKYKMLRKEINVRIKIVNQEEFDKKQKVIMKDINEILKKHNVKLSSKKTTFVACDKCHKSIQLTIRLEG